MFFSYLASIPFFVATIFVDGNLSSYGILFVFLSHSLLLGCSIISVRFSALSPFVIMYYVHYMANTMRGLYLYFSSEESSYKYYIANVNMEIFNDGALLVFVSSVSLTIGALALFSRKKKIKLNLGPHDNGYSFDTIAFYLLLLFGFMLLYMIVGSSSSGFELSAKRVFDLGNGESTRFGPLRFVLNILVFMFNYIFLVRYFAIKKFSDKYIVLSLLYIIIVSILISKRSLLLVVFLPVILIAINQLSFKVIIKMFSGVLLLLIIIGYISLQRKNDGVDFQISAVAELTTKAAMESANFGGLIPTAISTVLIENKFNVLFGKTLFIDPIAQFIPRSIYKEKPEELGGRIRKIHQEMGVAPIYIEGGVPPGFIAEAWLNGGILFVIVTSIIIGLIFSKITMRLSSSIGSREMALLFMFSEVMVFYGFGGHLARVVNYSVSIILGVFFLYVLTLFIRALRRYFRWLV